MLERVPLLDKHLADYEDAVGAETLDRIRELAAPLHGARVLHVNATAYGGGVHVQDPGAAQRLGELTDPFERAGFDDPFVVGKMLVEQRNAFEQRIS